jgi:hypothetical protein
MLFSYKTVGLKGIYGMAKRNGKYSQLVALGSLHRFDDALWLRCSHVWPQKA